MNRPQYKDYLNQALHVPSTLPPQPKSPTSRANPPLPQHHKTHHQDHTEAKIFVTPSTNDKKQQGSILKELKSFNRFNSSRNKSIKSANRSSIDRISANKSERTSRDKVKQKNQITLPLDNKSSNFLNPYQEPQTLRKYSGRKSHTQLRNTLDNKATSRDKIVRKSPNDPSKTYGDYSTHLKSDLQKTEQTPSISANYVRSYDRTPEKGKNRPATSYQQSLNPAGSLLNPISFRDRSKSRERSSQIKQYLKKRQSHPPSPQFGQLKSETFIAEVKPASSHTVQSPSYHEEKRSNSFVPQTHSRFRPSHEQQKNKYSSGLSIDDFVLGKKLGEGRFGNVFMAIHKKSGSIFALKRVPKATIKQSMMIDQFALEVRIQASFNHPNIVTIYAVFDDKEHVYLLLEYLYGGSLYGELKKKGKYQQIEAAQIVQALCKAIQALHLSGVAHRDIKPENIMMCEGQCKLGDFGWATICNELRMTYCGTTDYVSPEIIEGKQYGPSVDMWCIGVFAYELLAGKAPFYHFSRQQTMKRIGEATPTYPNFFSKKAVDFIEKLLKKVPEERMCAPDTLIHPFLTQVQTNSK